MIEQTVEELTPVIGTRPACRALGAAPATIYRRRRPPAPRPRRPASRSRPGRCLSPSARPCWPSCTASASSTARPRRSGRRCSTRAATSPVERTMYRLLAAEHGRVRERRDQLAHPAYAAPELLAERPNELWSWDITKLLGPAKWTYFYLYVILDVFSRYAVGWTVQHREIGRARQGADRPERPNSSRSSRGTLTVHADRGSSMTSKARRVPARRSRRRSRATPALHLDRQPLLRGAVQDAQVPARLPRSLPDHRAARELRPQLL